MAIYVINALLGTSKGCHTDIPSHFLLGPSYDSNPTILTRAPQEGQGSSITLTLQTYA